MVIALIIIVVLGIFIYRKSLLKQPIIMLSLIVLFFGQQIIMTHDSRQRTIDPYSTTINTLSDPSYYNDTTAKKLILSKNIMMIHFIVLIICRHMH